MSQTNLRKVRYVSQEYDIIVVGAGLSGLTAALTIAERDRLLNVGVLEATENVGGRRYTKSNSISFCSEKNLFLRKLLRFLKIQLIELGANKGYTGDFGKGPFYSTGELNLTGNKLEVVLLRSFFAQLESQSRKVSFQIPAQLKNSAELDKMSMETYIRSNLRSETSRNFVRAIIETVCGMKPDKVSVLFYLCLCRSTCGIYNQFTDENGGMGLIIDGGVMAICRRIVELIGKRHVMFNEKVQSLTLAKNDVLVETENTKYQCRYVIVAVPPDEVLALDIQPPLSATRTTILKGMQVGTRHGSLFAYNQNFFREQGVCANVKSSEGNIIRCRDMSGYKLNSIYCISREMGRMAIIEQLREYYKFLTRDPDAYFEFNFRNYFYVPAFDTLANMRELKWPLGRVFWAGSESAVYGYGELEGAVQSGTRAGIEVLYDFKPQTVTMDDITTLQKVPEYQGQFEDSIIFKLQSNKKRYAIWVSAVTLAVMLIVWRIKRRWW